MAARWVKNHGFKGSFIGQISKNYRNLRFKFATDPDPHDVRYEIEIGERILSEPHFEYRMQVESRHIGVKSSAVKTWQQFEGIVLDNKTISLAYFNVVFNL
jgi:hypothetical protein